MSGSGRCCCFSHAAHSSCAMEQCHRQAFWSSPHFNASRGLAVTLRGLCLSCQRYGTRPAAPSLALDDPCQCSVLRLHCRVPMLVSGPKRWIWGHPGGHLVLRQFISRAILDAFFLIIKAASLEKETAKAVKLMTQLRAFPGHVLRIHIRRQ